MTQRIRVKFHFLVVGNSLVVEYASNVETQRRLCHGWSRSAYVFVRPVDFELLEQLRVDQSQLFSVMHSLLHSSELRPVAPVRVLVVLHQNHSFVKSDVFLQRSLFYGQRFEIFLVTSEFRSLICGQRNVATQHVLGTLTYAVDEFLVALLYVLSLSSVCRPTCLCA